MNASILVTILWLLTAPAFSPASLPDQAVSPDTAGLDAVIQSLYKSLTFPEGGAPDFLTLRDLYTPEASFVRVNKDGSVDRMNRDSFIASFRERVEKGLVKSFHESEIRRKTALFGGMAHVLSVYRKGINITDPQAMGRGVNSFQLVFDGGQWKICGALWMDERPGSPIPEDFLR